MQIKGKTALVTGGAHRLGKAITMMLARAGANVVVNYHRSGEAAAETAAEAGALGVDAVPIQADISNRGQVQQMVQRAQDRFGAIQILINNADYFGKHTVPADEYSTWHRVIDIAVHGTFYVTNEVCREMVARGEGVIVNMLDTSLWQAWPNFTAHAVAKNGLMALTRQLASELAPAVRVNAVAPGMVLPPSHYDEAQIRRAAERTLLKRIGAPADVTGAIRYLIEADWVTGEVIRVDGGEQG